MPCINGLKLKEKKTPIKNMYMHTFHFVSNTTVRTENKDFEQVVGIVLLVVGNKNLHSTVQSSVRVTCPAEGFLPPLPTPVHC